MNKPIMLLTGVLAVTFLAGCNNTSTTAKKTVPATGTATKEEYVQYTSLGSRIPRKVKKTDVAPSGDGSKEIQETFRELQSRGTLPPTNVHN